MEKVSKVVITVGIEPIDILEYIYDLVGMDCVIISCDGYCKMYVGGELWIVVGSTDESRYPYGMTKDCKDVLIVVTKEEALNYFDKMVSLGTYHSNCKILVV